MEAIEERRRRGMADEGELGTDEGGEASVGRLVRFELRRRSWRREGRTASEGCRRWRRGWCQDDGHRNDRDGRLCGLDREPAREGEVSSAEKKARDRD